MSNRASDKTRNIEADSSDEPPVRLVTDPVAPSPGVVTVPEAVVAAGPVTVPPLLLVLPLVPVAVVGEPVPPAALVMEFGVREAPVVL